MTAGAEAIILSNDLPSMEKISGSSSSVLKAPFFLRCAALFIDYMFMMMIPVTSLLFSQFFGEGITGSGISNTVWFFVVLLWVLNFLMLPLFRGQTLGKMISGITIVNVDGSPVRLGRLMIRNTLGYLITILTLGLSFLICAINKSGRSLHDYIAGTVVVQGRRTLS